MDAADSLQQDIGYASFFPLLITAQILLSAWGLGQEEVDFSSYVEARGKDTGKYDLSELFTKVKTLVMSWTISNIVAEISEILWKCR